MNRDVSASNLSTLRKLNWIDKQTRAVLIQFTIYNANTDLFGYFVLVFEFLPIGSVKTSSTVAAIDLLGTNNSIQNVVMIVFLAIVVFMLVKEILQMLSLKGKYFYRWPRLIDAYVCVQCGSFQHLYV